MIENKSEQAGIDREEGYIEVSGSKIWYERVGKKENTPLIVLHGGPGFTHYYLEPLEKLADGKQVIFYDQLGCGKSDRPEGDFSWTVEYFVKELETIIDSLNLKDFYILGHSWGGALAIEYFLKNPKSVKGMILASPLISSSEWEGECKGLIKTLSPKTQEILLGKNTQSTSPEEYTKATDEFYENFFCRIKPTPKIIKKSIEEHGEETYTSMWGSEDFKPTGTLKNYNISPRLSQVSIPVLFTCGKFDEATPLSVKKWSNLIPNSRVAVFEKSGHFPHIEEEKPYLETIQDFLNSL